MCCCCPCFKPSNGILFLWVQFQVLAMACLPTSLPHQIFSRLTSHHCTHCLLQPSFSLSRASTLYTPYSSSLAIPHLQHFPFKYLSGLPLYSFKVLCHTFFLFSFYSKRLSLTTLYKAAASPQSLCNPSSLPYFFFLTILDLLLPHFLY